MAKVRDVEDQSVSDAGKGLETGQRSKIKMSEMKSKGFIYPSQDSSCWAIWKKVLLFLGIISALTLVITLPIVLTRVTIAD